MDSNGIPRTNQEMAQALLARDASAFIFQLLHAVDSVVVVLKNGQPREASTSAASFNSEDAVDAFPLLERRAGNERSFVDMKDAAQQAAEGICTINDITAVSSAADGEARRDSGTYATSGLATVPVNSTSDDDAEDVTSETLTCCVSHWCSPRAASVAPASPTMSSCSWDREDEKIFMLAMMAQLLETCGACVSCASFKLKGRIQVARCLSYSSFFVYL
jgi:hypothetical protein